MRFIAEPRRHEQSLRIARQENIAARIVRDENLHSFGKPHRRDVRHADLPERRPCRTQLRNAAVADEEVGARRLCREGRFRSVAPPYDLRHAARIIRTLDRLDAEVPVVAAVW